MQVSFQQFKGCRVETVSGIFLGKVFGIFFETDGQLITHYVVKKNFLSKSKHISREQIVRFSKNTLIVDDTLSAVSPSEEQRSSVMPSEALVMDEVQ